jgi:hypothetical protein
MFLLITLLFVSTGKTLPPVQIVNPIEPLHVVWSNTRPSPIPGYQWAETIYFPKEGFTDVQSWGLFRTNYSPPNNKALFKRLGVPPEEVWSRGRWDDTDYVPHISKR